MVGFRYTSIHPWCVCEYQEVACFVILVFLLSGAIGGVVTGLALYTGKSIIFSKKPIIAAQKTDF
jgi:hypothetical protein